MQPVTFFKCLSDDTRLQSILLIHQIGEACVCELMTALELDQPKISRHLAELRKCNILQDERRGKWVYYQLHGQLPDWAKHVISHTADANHSYIAQPLAKLRAAQQTSLSC